MLPLAPHVATTLILIEDQLVHFIALGYIDSSNCLNVRCCMSLHHNLELSPMIHLPIDSLQDRSHCSQLEFLHFCSIATLLRYILASEFTCTIFRCGNGLCACTISLMQCVAGTTVVRTGTIYEHWYGTDTGTCRDPC